MAILSRRRPFTETLPDGSTVYEALRRLSRGDNGDDERPLDRAPLDRMAGVASSPVTPDGTSFRRVAPPAVPAPSLPAPATISPDFEPLSRSVAPQIPSLSTIGAPPTMIERNNKGRPVAITGGDDPIKANQQLIRAQEGYKAPRSTKDQILSFLQGGVPGGVAYATDQNTRNRWAVGGDIAREEGRIGRELAVQKSQNELLNDQTKRELESAQAIRAAREPRTPPLVRYGDYTISPSEAARLAQEKELAANKRSARPPVKQADENGNEYLADADTGEPLKDARGNIRYTSRAKPEKPDEAPKDYATRQRNFSAAQSKYRGLIEEEKAAAQAKDAAYAAYSTARDQWIRQGKAADIQPDVIKAKAAADAAQAHYASFWGKKDAVKAEMLQHGDGVDANGEPLPPKAMTRGSRRSRTTGPAPTTHGFSVAGWLSRNPGKTAADAQAFHDNDPKYKAFPIIP